MQKMKSIPESESLVLWAPGVGIGINSSWLIQSWNRNRNQLHFASEWWYQNRNRLRLL